MIDLPSDIEDRAAYLQVDQADRWIFNKLTLAELLGYRCGVSGAPITVAGDYVVRPIMNVAGNSLGGAMLFTAETTARPDDGDRVIGGITQPPYAPGYFWAQAFTGEQGWTAYTNDVAVDEASGTPAARRFDYDWRTTNFRAPALPVLLQGLSTHLLVEWIDGNIIEVAPRHMAYENGRGTSYYERARAMPPWGEDSRLWHYWRSKSL